MNHCYIFMGPSGSGKTTLASAVFPPEFKIVSYTTREPRIEEQNGVHYHFVTKKKFFEMIESNSFAEYDQYDNHYYGVSLKSVQDKLTTSDCYNVLTPTGFWNLRDQFGPTIVPIYIQISKRHLKSRLKNRGETPQMIAQRIELYEHDLQQLESLKKLSDLMIIHNDAEFSDAILQLKLALKYRAKKE